MFDIGFPELLLISVVALLVIGPERLPETIRTVALWIGLFRRSFSAIKQELEREIGADEIRQQLHNETIMKEIERSKEHIEDFRSEVKSTVEGTVTEIKSVTDQVGNDSKQQNL